MKGKQIAILVVAVLLAIGSFAFARHRYVSENSAKLTNPFGGKESTTLTNPFMEEKLFGDWIKDHMLFAVIVPVAFMAGGAVLAFKK
jgi:hypothetical protein